MEALNRLLVLHRTTVADQFDPDRDLVLDRFAPRSPRSPGAPGMKERDHFDPRSTQSVFLVAKRHLKI